MAVPARKRDKILYKEQYIAPGLRVKTQFLPRLKHTNGLPASEVFITAAGRVLRDGVEVEYQDLRVYFQEEKKRARS